MTTDHDPDAMATPLRCRMIGKMPVMSRDELCATARDGDLVFGSARYFASWAIRIGTCSPLSHVAIVVMPDDGSPPMLLEAVEDYGVRLVLVDDYFHDYEHGEPYRGTLVLARRTDVSPETAIVAIAAGGHLVGRDYDQQEIRRIILRLLRYVFQQVARFLTAGLVRFKRRPPHQDGLYICSELVAHCYKRAGVRMRSDWRGFYSPASLWRDRRVRMIGRVL